MQGLRGLRLQGLRSAGLERLRWLRRLRRGLRTLPRVDDLWRDSHLLTEMRDGGRLRSPMELNTFLMTGDHGNSFTLRNSKDVPQFAPNFSVYVLPPDVVCLYSEDRKFFLHGELYCALASAIGKGGRSFREIVRELEQDFPSDEIHEALKRLIERRHVLPASRYSAGTAAAYWASLGLSPETAESNLRKCRVRIQSIDVQGATELDAALRGLGVHVVKRSPDLTVTLVNDYLEGQLAELNRQHLSDRTPWMLVQPSGIFPLVGPVFNPGKGACWTCVADRMKRNREVKALLDREQARCVAVSPLARHTFGQSAIQFAAVEIAKAIATDFRTEMRDHIISLDLMGSTTVKHYVRHRPQCPSCGRKRLRDPGRAPVPIELGAGGKLVMTSGGYRTVSPRATVARFRKHVSPLTGVVSRLERIEVDLPLNTNYYATHNFSAPARTVDRAQGRTEWRQLRQGQHRRARRSQRAHGGDRALFRDFSGRRDQGEKAVHRVPGRRRHSSNDVLLFSDAQYRATRRRPPTRTKPRRRRPRSIGRPRSNGRPPGLCATNVQIYSDQPPVFFLQRPGAIMADSNGCAAGNTLEEAIVQGFLELVERDAYATWWYNRMQRAEVDLSQFDDSYVRDLKTQLAETGRRLWVLDVTSDLGIPTYVAILHWMKAEGEYRVRSGAHFDSPNRLAARADRVEPISVHRSHGRRHRREIEPRRRHSLRLQDHPFLIPSGIRRSDRLRLEVAISTRASR